MYQFRQLHIIRGLAALYVAMGHAKVVFWSGGQEYIAKNPRDAWNLWDYFVFATDMFSSAAQEFVIVFFILSGFFIAHSLEKNKWSIKDFILTRIIRIYPPYLFSVLVAIGVFFFIHAYYPFLFSGVSEKPILIRMSNSWNELDFSGFLKALIFLPKQDYIAGNLSYWSLLPEWIFYLVIPFLAAQRNIAFIVFAGFFVTNLFLQVPFENVFLKFLFEYGFYFFLGTYLLRLVQNETLLNKIPPKRLSYLILIGLAVVTVGCGAAEIKPYSNIVPCLLTFWAIITLISYPIRGVSFKVGVFLGDISYSLYVLHLPIYYFLYALLTKQTGMELFYDRIYWFAIPIAVFLSWLAYLLVEKRTMNYIELIKRKR